jgi:hypothetical protein
VLLRRVNGLARTLSSDARPVGLTGRFSDETGRHHQVVLADSAEVRARANPVRVSVGGEQAPAPPSPGPGYVQLAQIHPDVAQVLDLLGNADPAPGWAELYKVYEILLDSVHGFSRRGWVTRDQIRAFRASANRSEVSGDLARHARLKGDPVYADHVAGGSTPADRCAGQEVAGLAAGSSNA